MHPIPSVFAVALVAATTVIATTLAPAFAQERPVIHPTRDAMIDYRVEGRTQNGPQTIRMYVTAGGHKTRIEPSGGRTAIIIDRPAGVTVIVMYDRRSYMERPISTTQASGFEVGRQSDQFSRKGSETIAGRRCTLWESGGQRTSVACITDDGLILRGESQAAGGGERSSLIATNVQVGPVSPEMFNPPAGFDRFAVPNMQGIPGSGIPGTGIPGVSMPSMPSAPSGFQLPGGFAIPRP